MPIFIVLFLFFAALAPSLVWFWFFLKEDIHPEPRRLLVRVFTIGALATAPTLFLQISFKAVTGLDNFGILLFGFAVIEEIVKFAAVWYAVRKNPAFDEPIDAMIYMVAGAAGFATVENILIAVGSVEAVSLATLSAASGILLLRFIGATLLHVLASATVGYYWAKARATKNHFGPLVQGVVLAILIHVGFNQLVAIFGETNLLYASIVLLTAGFFVIADFEILKTKSAV